MHLLAPAFSALLLLSACAATGPEAEEGSEGVSSSASASSTGSTTAGTSASGSTDGSSSGGASTSTATGSTGATSTGTATSSSSAGSTGSRSSASGSSGGRSSSASSSSGGSSGTSGASCPAPFQSATSFTCGPDGAGRAICRAPAQGGYLYESCARGCLREAGATDDVCLGTTDPWSCTGSYGTAAARDGDYFATTFGCWTDAQGVAHSDTGDNCIPSCLSQAQRTGLCTGMTGPECENHLNWYVADGARFGCLARLKVTDVRTGRAVIAVALDYGPGCSIERRVSKAVLDTSGRVSQYLFGGEVGATERRLVHVVQVDDATPLGPVP